MDSDDLARRLRAARALTPPTAEELAQRAPSKRGPEPGINRDELAQRINEAGLGEKVLGKIERGEKTPARRDLIAIAEALELPLTFFSSEREDLLRQLRGDGAPGIGGVTGRRVEALRPSREDQQQPESHEGEETQHAAP